ncbi:antibiotic biosynthesis monooxygenase [Streptomyces sp. CA-250714]|uniref:antibiotic biosynthesis monooxygenase n=1 Tax=Streptomyces sp. CA-250714 TaxID=3240060 RepID=UPI003D932EA2
MPDAASSDAAHADAETGLTVFGTWRVGAAARQRAAVDALAAAWSARPWPTRDLRAYDVLASIDGATLLHRSQWAVQDAQRAVLPDRSWKDEVDRAVPGIERAGVIGGQLHRSRTTEDTPRAAGCIVLVTRTFDGSDPARARARTDALFEATADTPAPAGLLSARFYLSPDGRHVLNYAEWTDAEAHQAAITQPPPETVDRAQWRQVHDWPGLTHTTFDRFHPGRQITGANARR